MDNARVSVCLSFYNSQKYLKKCLGSIFSQTVSDIIELVLVDDGSVDNSSDIVASMVSLPPPPPVIRNSIYSKHLRNIKYIKNEQNKGLAFCRNLCLQNSSSEYVTFIDADDYLEPDFVEKLLTSAIDNDSDISYCDFYREYLKKSQINQKENCKTGESLLKYELISANHMIWSKLIKKELFIKNNICWADKIDMHEDLVISTKLLSKASKVSHVNKPLYHYVKYNNSSMTFDGKINHDKNNILSVVNEISGILADKPEILFAVELELKISALINCSLKNRKTFYSLFPDIPLKAIQIINSPVKKIFSFFLILKMYLITDLLITMRNTYTKGLNNKQNERV